MRPLQLQLQLQLQPRLKVPLIFRNSRAVLVDELSMRGIEKLMVGDVTLDAIGALRFVVARIRLRDRALSEQLVRAMNNVALSIARAEFPVEGTRRGHLFAALASACEAQAVLQIAIDSGYAAEQRGKPARALLDKTRNMLCELVRHRQ